MKQKDICLEYVKKWLPDTSEIVIPQLEHYYELLIEVNSVINIYSRKMDTDDIWTLHFLDSLLLLQTKIDLKGKVLDFGTGGGLPGIPLRITYPAINLSMLDARRKKIQAIEEMIEELELDKATGIWSRLEDYCKYRQSSYDFIVCRSVRITPELKPLLLKLLKPKGKIVLYKSKNLDDVEQFKNRKEIDVSHPVLGTRKLIVIGKE